MCVTEGDTGAPHSQPTTSATTTTAASPGATYCVRSRIRRSQSMWKSVGQAARPSGGKINSSRGDVFIPAHARRQSTMMERRSLIHGHGPRRGRGGTHAKEGSREAWMGRLARCRAVEPCTCGLAWLLWHPRFAAAAIAGETLLSLSHRTADVPSPR